MRIFKNTDFKLDFPKMALIMRKIETFQKVILKLIFEILCLHGDLTRFMAWGFLAQSYWIVTR